MGKVSVVVGGQFGSEAKGHVAAYLSKRALDSIQPPVCVRVGGPNAGHTGYDQDGNKWVFRQIPIGAAIDPRCEAVIAAGSEIDLPVLEDEMAQLEKAGKSVEGRLFIDGQCTMIEDKHKEEEGNYGGHLTQRLGSTGKGIGAARADRVWRKARIWESYDPSAARTAALIRHRLGHGTDVIVEAAQGFGLGLHIGFYPYCTSADGRAIDALADAGISPWAPWVDDVEVWVVLRTFPIRVAGNSGPLSNEISWEELANRTGGYVQPEKTTVTQKVRRVGEWDPTLAAWAVESNGGSNCNVALMFFDYEFPELAGATKWEEICSYPGALELLLKRQQEIGAPIRLVGTGPSTMVEVPRG